MARELPPESGMYVFRAHHGPAKREGGIPMIRKWCFVFFALAWGVSTVSPARALPAKTADDIEYVMPPGWVAKETPGAKAYYVLMHLGNPVGEMYLTKEPLFEQKTPATVLREGLRKNSAGIEGYQAIKTSNIALSGIDAVLHDFLYYSPGSPVPFTGRAVVLIVNNAAYTFFFNTTTGTFPLLEGAFGEILASVRPVRKTKAAPRRVQEDVFSIELSPEWRDSNDPQGAKYRYYDATDTLLASFLVFGRNRYDEETALTALKEKKDPLERVLNSRIAPFKTDGEYTPLGTKSLRIAGCDAVVHDFSLKKPDSHIVHRLCVIALRQQESTASRIFAPAVYDFTFIAPDLESFNSVKGDLDALLDSITLVRPLPPVTPAPPFADVEDERIFRSPTDSFTVTLPEGAKKDAVERLDPIGVLGESFTYTIEGMKDTTILISVFYDALDGEDAHGNLLDDLEAKESGRTTWNVQGRDVPVGLYSARGGQALVTALFADDSLLVAVVLPKKEYARAQGWIKELINGVRF